MGTIPGDRSAHFPAIENKHGRPIAYWLAELAALGDAKYPEQIAFLRERHEFSQAHANAVVMYARGSTTARRHADPERFFRELGGDKERTARAIFAAITAEFADLEMVIAWNQPMLKRGKDYVFGLSAATNHLLLGPWGANSVELVRPLLNGLDANKKTIKVPIDWQVDATLLHALVRARLAEISGRR
jgi:uncharacterized protein YdhG (YjbR/CyaY superfamily)